MGAYNWERRAKRSQVSDAIRAAGTRAAPLYVSRVNSGTLLSAAFATLDTVYERARRLAIFKRARK